MRARARIALVLIALCGSFGLAGCAAIEELKEAFLRWVESEKLPPAGRGPFADDLPDATPVIPPAGVWWMPSSTMAAFALLRATSARVARRTCRSRCCGYRTTGAATESRVYVRFPRRRRGAARYAAGGPNRTPSRGRSSRGSPHERGRVEGGPAVEGQHGRVAALGAPYWPGRTRLPRLDRRCGGLADLRFRPRWVLARLISHLDEACALRCPSRTHGRRR